MFQRLLVKNIKNMNKYNNYHKHTHISSIFTPDSNAHTLNYVNRALELGHNNVFTTEHGSGGDIFEAKSLCDTNGLNCKFGMEGYIVKNPLEKDARNYHIVLIPKTNEARKKLNKASSRANIEGYYYRPRLFLSDLLEKFEPNELYITTACCAGIIRDDDGINDIFYPLYEKFGKNLMLEVQTHKHDKQLIINSMAIKLSNELGLDLIGANDSHYIYPEQYKDRFELLKGKDIEHKDEDSFILDYPDYDTMCSRFKEQGLLTTSQIVNCIDNTLIFDDCEDICITKDIKMPTIYPDLDDKAKIELLKNIINKEYKKVMVRDNVDESKIVQYIQEIKKEMQVIEDTTEVHTVDYFLLNYKLTQLAINKYNGVLTRSGRGSCGAFIINKILGITQIDRLAVNLPIYSERFMSTARILENHALPDIDFNIATQEPFVKASRELLGNLGCYPMIAYGTMQESESFRNLCRARELKYDEYNEVAKNIDLYRVNPQWKNIIEDAQKYVGTIKSASPHACAHLLSNDDIEEEIGVIRIGDVMCAMITSSEADEWKYLKNDYLVVTVWDIIAKTFDMIGEPIITVKELMSKLDDRVWDLFRLGMTSTLNQVDGDWATHMIKQYQPKSLEELSMFVGAIRPSFEAFRDGFLRREEYTTGSKELDELFEQTGHYVIFQENLMQYFEWLGVSPADSVGLIKKISKKKIKPKDFEELTGTLRENWIKNVGNDDQFDEMWDKMQAMLSYSFNASHGEATAIDCLYCAYLKVNYPLEYYTVVLNIYDSNEDKTNRLLEEMKYFGIELSPIKFRYSKGEYMPDKATNNIYKGISSIKGISSSNGEELYELRDNTYDSFVDLLNDISTTKVNKTQLDILIKLNFFEEFGDINYLLYIRDMYNKFGEAKVITKSKLTPYELKLIEPYAHKTTEKQLREIDIDGLLKEICNQVITPTTLYDRVGYELELLGYSNQIIEDAPATFYGVCSIDKNKYGTPYATLYRLKDGIKIDCKIDKTWYKEHPCKQGDILDVVMKEKPKKRKDENGNWIELEETENIVKVYSKL